jgi:hypothetical protein
VRTAPPLRALAAATEVRFPGRLASTQSVRVSVDSAGRPFRVVDVDRIAIAQKGDYSFVITAPVEDVRAPAGASAPGLRNGAVVWQGFSPGRRVLTAAVTLRLRSAATSLPLRVEVGRSGLRLVNTTSTKVTTVDANIPPAETARVLDTTRTVLAGASPISAPTATAVGTVRNVQVIARVPLRVTGTIRFASGASRRVEAVVGQAPVRITGADLKSLALSVSVPLAASVLRPPGARTWLDLARSGGLPDGRATTRLAVNRLLSAAVALQFHQFLANPDASGVTRTSYRYELARHPQTLADEPPPGGDRGWLVPLGVALAVTFAAVGALVLWAHS